MQRKVLLPLCAGLLANGCAGRAIESRFQPIERPTEEVVINTVSAAQKRVESPVVVALLEGEGTLAMWDLSSGTGFQVPVTAQSNPIIAGNAIVMQEEQGIVVRDLKTGALRVVAMSDGKLVSADGEGDRVVISVSHGQADPPSTIVFVEGDKVRFRERMHLPAGAPAIVGEFVLVPWATQRLSALSTKDGAEVARVAFTNMVVSRVDVEGPSVFVGQQNLLRITPDLKQRATVPGEGYGPLKRDLPGKPTLPDGYEPLAAPESAKNRIQLALRPVTKDEHVNAQNGLLVEQFYRVLLGFDADQDKLRFVRRFDHDLVATEIVEGGVLTADAQGTLRAFSPDGKLLSSRALEKPIKVAVFRASKIEDVSAWDKAGEAPLESLHDALLETAKIDDARLAPLRGWATKQLGALDHANVTAELIAFCESRTEPELVRTESCDALSQRKDGAREVVLALRRRGSFLENTPPPPVGALAKAAVQMKLQEAGPLLVSHLEDENTRVEDLVPICAALAALDYRPAIAVLERFVRVHHAEPQGSDMGKALLAAIDALAELRGPTSRDTLVAVASDPLTAEPVRAEAKKAISTIDTPKATEAPKGKAKDATAAAAEQAPEVQVDPRPWSLSSDDVLGAFRKLRAPLLRCLSSEPANVSSARISLVITAEGEVDGSYVTPTTVQGCMDPILRTARFPATRLGRQHVTHTLRADGKM